MLAAEDRRYRAMQDADLTTLDELCADALSYAHSSGVRDTKDEYLGKVALRLLRLPADRPPGRARRGRWATPRSSSAG